MTPLPSSKFPSDVAPSTSVGAAGSSSMSSPPFATWNSPAAAKPGDVNKPSDAYDSCGWLEWLAQSPADEMAERVTVVQREANVRMILFVAGHVAGPVFRRVRVEREAMAQVAADDERRYASGRQFWA